MGDTANKENQTSKFNAKMIITLYNLIKQLRWARINVSKRVLEGNFVIDLGILGYGFRSGKLKNVIHTLIPFVSFLVLCLIIVLIFAFIESLMLGYYKNK